MGNDDRRYLKGVRYGLRWFVCPKTSGNGTTSLPRATSLLSVNTSALCSWWFAHRQPKVDEVEEVEVEEEEEEEEEEELLFCRGGLFHVFD